MSRAREDVRSTRERRTCATCGEPLAYSGRGRPPVTHPGSCTRQHRNQTDEARRWERYEETLWDAATRAPLLGVEHVDTDGDEGSSIVSRLASEGFAPVYDDPREDVPKRERAATAHRDAVLASVAPTFAEERRKVKPARMFAREHDVTRCYGCPLFDHLAVVHVFTAETLLRSRVEVREDVRVRRHLAEDDLGALMARRPE